MWLYYVCMTMTMVLMLLGLAIGFSPNEQYYDIKLFALVEIARYVSVIALFIAAATFFYIGTTVKVMGLL